MEHDPPWARLRPSAESLWDGEDCLSEASSAALVFGTGAKGPGGPRTGGNGFGSPKQKDLVARGRNPANVAAVSHAATNAGERKQRHEACPWL